VEIAVDQTEPEVAVIEKRQKHQEEEQWRKKRTKKRSLFLHKKSEKWPFLVKPYGSKVESLCTKSE
jgi:hypothetical protein